jgi:hypothetical protein
MNRLSELDSIRPDLERWIEGTAQKMGDSAICLSIFTKNYKKGIDSLLQFAVAIMLDKPLYLLAPDNVEIPQHVKKIASSIELYKEGDPKSFEDAGLRLHCERWPTKSRAEKA